MMKTSVVILFVGCIVQVGGAQTPGRAKVEQRLAELLAPGSKAPGTMLPPTPPLRKPVASIENPELPQKSTALSAPAPPKPAGKPVQPRTLSEGVPLASVFNQPEGPQAITMATTPLVRLWSWDVNEPAPLPILGTALRDRASLDDPSLEASVAATLAKLTPARAQSVPFQPHNLPDPFEHTQSARLRNPPDELAEPPLSIRPFGR